MVGNHQWRHWCVVCCNVEDLNLCKTCAYQTLRLFSSGHHAELPIVVASGFIAGTAPVVMTILRANWLQLLCQFSTHAFQCGCPQFSSRAVNKSYISNKNLNAGNSYGTSPYRVPKSLVAEIDIGYFWSRKQHDNRQWLRLTDILVFSRPWV